MKCRGCQQDNPSHANFCLKCGVPLKGADPTAKGYTNPKDEVEGLRRSLTEALERQTATSEVLSIIASSPADVQPVFQAILAGALRLCGATYGLVNRYEGGQLHLTAVHNVPDEHLAELRTWFPLAVDTDVAAARAVRDRTVVQIEDVLHLPTHPVRDAYRSTFGYRAWLSVPMLRGDEPIGVISIWRSDPGPFHASQVELLKLFADQAVIAIENVRLFNETKEALDRQTATAEILSVISSSPTDIQPVLDAVAQSAARLCGAKDAQIYRVEGESLRRVTSYGPILPSSEKRAISRAWVTGRAVVDRRTIHVHDLAAETDTEYRGAKAYQEQSGHRTTLATPLLREGVALGAILIRRMEVLPFSDAQIKLLETFADQAVIAIENVRLFTELQEKNEALTQAHAQVSESLEQQTATSEILRVISSSPTDVQPVFDAIVRTGVGLCEADYGFLARYDGTSMAIVAHFGATNEEIDTVLRVYPMAPRPDSLGGRTILERAVIHIPDVRSDPTYGPRVIQDAGWRTGLGVPLLREGAAIGLVGMWRRDVHPFSDRQIELVKTFADQAVIAIENVRLFKELQARNRQLTEALDQQTATGQILRVISSSPTDIQPVFDCIAESAVRLCRGMYAGVARVDGEFVNLAAHYNFSSEALALYAETWPQRLSRDNPTAHAILDRTIVEVPDIDQATGYSAATRERAHALGYRAIVVVPLLHGDIPIGAIGVSRREPGRFPEDHIQLLKTFADQAVIAIENVRLFSELQASNRDLRAALDTQTATSEILSVISRSQTDVQPVFDAIVASAIRLLRAHEGVVTRIVGDQLELAAATFTAGGEDPTVRARFPRPVRGGVHGQAIRDRAPVNIANAQTGPEASEELRAVARALGYRSLAAVPLLRNDEAIGTIAVVRGESGGFTPDEIALLKTFADQAVIAIENARLFRELQEKNRALTQAHAQVTEALERQTATAEVLRVISSSPTDVQPVLDAVVESAVRLCAAYDARIWRIDGDRLVRAAGTGPLVGESSSSLPLDPTLPAPAAFLQQRTVHFDETGWAADPRVIEAVRRLGIRSGVATPLMREGKPIGVLAVRSREPGRFSSKRVELLKTFADQAVIAIENVRLFTELQARNGQLTEALDRQTATADVLRVISQSQTELQPVFEAIVGHAMQLFKAWAVSVLNVDGSLVRLIATRGGLPGLEQQLREQSPWPIDTPSPVGACIADRTVVHIADIESDRTVDEGIRDLALKRGWRSILAAPILRDGEPIGAIAIQRAEARPFSSAEIDLLKTFADQAVIAIENTRLLGELQARTQQLTRSVEELTALGEVSRALGSTLDLDRVLQTIVTRASQLAGTDACSVFEYDEAAEAFHLRATNNLDDEVVTLVRQTPTRKGEGVQGRMALTRQPVQVPDIAAEEAYRGPLRDVLLRTGTRAVLAIPMLRENELIGGLTVNKRTPGEFSPEVIELLTTFATQSALAIQNARLFREIEDKSRQLETASQHKSEFLANMSHELRTPLNAIIGFSEVLSERMFGELNEKQDEYLKDIHASGQHLLSLINDILDLSKIEAGRMELEVSDFDLPTALDNALTLVRERAGRRGIGLHMNIDERLGQIRGDERKVRQVVLNLLSNAIKFTPEGGQIEVLAAPKNGLLEISVSDTGVGIAPEDQEAVFEEFRQVGTTEKRVEGTGLGLTLCRKFVELHGGRIWVKSEVGVGSTFTFTIPVRRGEESQ